MTVLAPEAAGTLSGGSGAALGGAAASGGGGGGGHSKGVLLAIAIILLWLAGFCFFIAFEGSTLLSEADSTTGGGLLKGIINGLASRTLKQEQGGTG